MKLANPGYGILYIKFVSKHCRSYLHSELIAQNSALWTIFTQAFHEAVDDYISACEKWGQPPENPASGPLMLRVNPKVHAAALTVSAHHDKV